MDDVPAARLDAIAGAIGVPTARYHVLICADQSTPRCASAQRSREVWTHLKRRLGDLGLSSPPPAWRGEPAGAAPPPTPAGTGPVLRSKVDCLRVCEQGPIAVVYPDGVWYRLVDEDAVDRIVEEHLLGGRVVDDLVFAEGPLEG